MCIKPFLTYGPAGYNLRLHDDFHFKQKVLHVFILRYVPWITIVGIMRCIVAKQNITASKHSRARIRDINTDLWQKKYEQYLPFYRISRCCKIWPATQQQHWHCHNISRGLFICLGSPYRIVLCSCVREKSIRIKGCRNCRYLTLGLQRMMGADSKVMYTIYFVLLPNFHSSAGTFLIWLSSLKFRAFELNTNKGFMDKYLDLQMAVIKHWNQIADILTFVCIEVVKNGSMQFSWKAF